MEKIFDQLAASASYNPNGVALRFERAAIKYKELLKQVRATANRLAGLGIKENDVVAMNLPNCVSAVYVLYALDYLGAIAYLIHPLTPDDQLSAFLSKAKAKALICLNVDAERIAASCPSVTVLAVNPYSVGNLTMRLLAHWKSGKLKKARYLTSLKEKEAKKSGKDPAMTSVYLNSGGTNGEPKIIMLGSAAIAELASRGHEIVDIEDGRGAKMYTVIPLFHGFGLAMGVCLPIQVAGTAVLDLKFHSKSAIKRMRRNQANIIIGVPALYNALLHNPKFAGKAIKNLVAAFVGGDSVSDSLLDRFDELAEKSGSKCRLHEGYGLTETVTVTNVNSDFSAKRGTVGKPLRGIEELILDLQTGVPLGPNQEGEVAISGPTLMNGYFEDPELTEKSFKTIDGKKYVLTRDLGYLDEEGYLHFRARLRRIAKVNGVIVCPADLERLSLEDEGVYESYCYAVPDPKLGQVLCLVLVKHRSCPDSLQTIERRIRESIDKRLPIYYKPKAIRFIEKLPRTAVGKVDDAAFKKEE